MKLQQQGLNSWGAEKPREKNRIVKSPYSAQMVDAYNKDLETPYTDPDTGTQYKYKMLPPPDLDELDDTQLIGISQSSSEIAAEVNKLKKLYDGDSPELKKWTKDISVLEKELYKLTNSTNARDKYMIPTYEKNLRKLITERYAYKNNLHQAMSDLITEKDIIEEAERMNKDIVNENKKINQQKLKDYRDSLNQLNKGALSLE